MPETWPLIALLLTIIIALAGLLWRTAQARYDESEKNWAKWRDEFTNRLLSIDMRLATIDLLDITLKRAMEDIKELEKWKHEKGIPYVQAVDPLEERVTKVEARVERFLNGKREP